MAKIYNCNSVKGTIVCGNVTRKCTLNTEALFGHSRFPGVFTYVDNKTGEVNQARIQKVLYSNPATVVFWDDGSKTISKCFDGDVYNPETGLVMCILKKINGSSSVKDTIDAWLPVGEEYKRGKSVFQTLHNLRKSNKY